MPDHFVIVGAQRCGTTYLYQLLDEHPDIEMAKPLRPEPKFFLDTAQYAHGLTYYEAQFFSDAGARVRGEKSTSYIESEVAAQRINAMLPGATIIVALRDPVARARSNYQFSAQHGVEQLPPAEAMHASARGDREWDHTHFSVSPFDYLPRGRYVEYLERLTRHIAVERLYVLFFEDLTRDPGTLPALYERLGVDPTFHPTAHGSVVNASDPNDEAADPELTAWLRAYFREPNERLATFLGRALPWPAS